MDDVKLKISKGGLLKEALAKLHIDEVNTNPVRDKYGIIGYEIGKYVLVAKPMFFCGDMVSCHKDVCWRAIKTGKKILFYISLYNSFYEFNATEVLSNGFRNRRGGAEMLNFYVSTGQKVSMSDLMANQLTLF